MHQVESGTPQCMACALETVSWRGTRFCYDLKLPSVRDGRQRLVYLYPPVRCLYVGIVPGGQEGFFLTPFSCLHLCAK